MSLSFVNARAVVGIESPPVRVETHLSNGLPSFTVVGLPEAAVKESRERVRSAIINSGFEFPMRRVTVNLAPADLPKEGGRFDLAIAIGLLAASGQLPNANLDNFEFIAELALSGACSGVRALLPSIRSAANCERKVIISGDDKSEAGLCRYEELYAAESLRAVVDFINATDPNACERVTVEPQANMSEEAFAALDIANVRGQFAAKKALLLAAVGGHNLLFFGPPGTGKSMLASRLPSILPPLSDSEALEVASLYSLAQVARPVEQWRIRPFRTPHHSSSAAALVGGGAKPKPGEVSLSHRGVLFLDELPEFSRQVLEVLREPIEAGEVSISRAMVSMQFPARFQLIAAMNPCPCGYLGHPNVPCKDTPQQIEQYRRKLSGPLLDRFDMHVEVPFQSAKVTLAAPEHESSSAEWRARVSQARALQLDRQACLNSELVGEHLVEQCQLTEKQMDFLATTIDRLALSARATHRTMRLARTIADISGRSVIEDKDLAQALGYRSLR